MVALRSALERQNVRILSAESCAQAKRMLGGLSPAPLVFTETHLPDGLWTDVLAVAEKAAQPVNVIVVDRLVDTRFYVETIETGAFDFLVPPFNATDLAYVVRSAVENAAARRMPHSRPVTAQARYAEVQEGGPSTTVS